MSICLLRRCGDRRGVTALEYAAVAGATVFAISAILPTIGTNLSQWFTAIAGAL
jgi:Flp pilus assembly pilin Flp